MPTTFDNEEYFETEEAMKALDVSRQHFYTNVRPRLRAYHFETKKKPWYRMRDILDLKEGRVERTPPPIVIPGIFPNWTQAVRSMGLQIDTLNREITIVSLDAEQLPATFHIEPYRQFAQRSRISFVNRQPICLWSSYYPLELVRGDLLAEMKADQDLDIVKRIAEQHGVTVAWAKDRYSARLASLEEQEALQLLRDEPIMHLQRVSYASDKKTLVLYSDMALLGSWFAPEHEYPVAHWQPALSVAPVPAAPSSESELAPGVVAWRSFVRQHGISDKTIQSAIERGEIPVITGSWQVGRTKMNKALDAAGCAAFYQQYHTSPNFKPCPDCPHDL